MERIYDTDLENSLISYFNNYKKIHKEFKYRELNYAMKSKTNYILYLHRVKNEIPTIKIPISDLSL